MTEEINMLEKWGGTWWPIDYDPTWKHDWTWQVYYSCPKCGLCVGVGDKFCRHCGAELHPKKYCPHCGKELREET